MEDVHIYDRNGSKVNAAGLLLLLGKTHHFHQQAINYCGKNNVSQGKQPRLPGPSRKTAANCVAFRVFHGCKQHIYGSTPRSSHRLAAIKYQQQIATPSIITTFLAPLPPSHARSHANNTSYIPGTVPTLAFQLSPAGRFQSPRLPPDRPKPSKTLPNHYQLLRLLLFPLHFRQSTSTSCLPRFPPPRPSPPPRPLPPSSAPLPAPPRYYPHFCQRCCY